MDQDTIKQEWNEEQTRLRKLLVQDDSALDFSFSPATNEFGGLRYVGGVDISYPRNHPDRAAASLVVVEYPSLQVVYEAFKEVQITVPYIAGYLAFREMEAYRELFAQLKAEQPQLSPQIVLVDGNGTLHPRRFGSACHLGVGLGIPTIGVAKNFLHIDDLDADARSLKSMFQGDPSLTQVEMVGASGIYGMAVAPPGAATNPIFVSVGHRVSLATAVCLVRACSLHRIPEPIRIADLHSRVISRQIEAAA
ncbi:endonuclease V [Linderina pennispora]|uniref:Endonuclease V n=1 Tax=Linderina pennispora TaxID=61395 RepID=A0A1Y1W1K7_9FUNG|nr:endonuclease V [Linderina pennispora]ORX67391.1 endonuclease V [Linderina pennispora]